MFSKKQTFLPVCYLLLTAAAPLRVEHVVLLMRHGVRPPTHEPALSPAIAPLPWPAWDTPNGFLTPHGAQAISLLAAYDRMMLAAEGLLPAAGCPAGVTVYADVDERTIKTAEAYAAALAPDCGLAVGHASGTDPLFSGLDQPPAGFDAKAAKAEMLAAAGGNVDAPMQAYPALFQKMQDALDPGGHAFLDLPAEISAKTPGKLPKLSGPLAEGASGAEDFLLEYLEGMPMRDVGWGRVNATEITTLLALHPLAYTVTARPKRIADAASAALAQRILAGLTDPGQKFTALVGHDTNIAELGGALDIHWQLGGYPADDPPPGGGMIFTLLRDGEGKKYVTLSYQVQTMAQIRDLTVLNTSDPPAFQNLPIPGCGNSTAPTACSLAAFTHLVAQLRHE